MEELRVGREGRGGGALQRRWAVLAAVVLVLSLGSAVPAGAAVTIDATPDTNLADGQVVTAHLTGLAAYASNVFVIQCVGTPAAFDTCDTGFYGLGTANGVGDADVAITASAIVTTPTHGQVDCRTPPPGEPCVLAGGSDPFGDLAATTLLFDPGGALRPPATLTASPDTGLVNGQTVTATGGGYPPNSFQSVQLCRTGTDGYQGCLPTGGGTALVDGVGNLLGTIDVVSGFFDGQTQVDCRVPGACELRVPLSPPQLTGRAPLTFDPGGALPSMPTLVASPATGLIDFQTIDVTGTGFPTSFDPMYGPVDGVPPVDIYECLAAAPFSCVLVGFGIPGAGGALATTVDVRAAIYSSVDAAVHDCRPVAGTCRLVALSYGAPDQAGLAPLTFDPLAPLAPPPSLAASPSTGLVDGQIIDLTGSDFVSTNGGFGPYPVPVAEAGDPATPPSPPAPPSPADVPLRYSESLDTFVPDLAAIEAAGDRSPQKTAVPGYTTVYQCVTAVAGWTGCDQYSSVGVMFDGTGALATRFQVHALVTLFDLGTGLPVAHDCRVEACELRAGEIGNPLASTATPITFDPAGSLRPAPSLTVTPVDGLVDQQLVRVQGENLPWKPDQQNTADIVECGPYPGPLPPDVVVPPCSYGFYLASVSPSEAGGFDTMVRVSATLPPGSATPQQTDCRAVPGSCGIQLYSSGGELGPVPLTFDPSAPLAGNPVVTVDPASGLAAGDTVQVHGDWFTPSADVEVVQCADSWLLTSLTCDDATAVAATTDAVGSVDAPLTLRRNLVLGDGTGIDCAVVECVVLVRNPAVWGEVAWAPVGILAVTGAPPAVVTVPQFAG